MKCCRINVNQVRKSSWCTFLFFSHMAFLVYGETSQLQCATEWTQQVNTTVLVKVSHADHCSAVIILSCVYKSSSDWLKPFALSLCSSVCPVILHLHSFIVNHHHSLICHTGTQLYVSVFLSSIPGLSRMFLSGSIGMPCHVSGSDTHTHTHIQTKEKAEGESCCPESCLLCPPLTRRSTDPLNLLHSFPCHPPAYGGKRGNTQE